MIPGGHPLIEEWRPWLENFEKGNGDMAFLAEPSDIKNGNVAKIQDMAMALQHYPHLIEKMVYAVRLDFNLVEGVHAVRNDDWKRDPKIRHWLFKMAQMSILIFFIKDSTTRFFMIADDVFSMQSEKPLPVEEVSSIIASRVFTASVLFLLYCHNTGFQPDPYIDALIAEHDMPFDLQTVKAAYQDAVEKGFSWNSSAN